MKKALTILCVVLLTALLLAGIYLANGFFGNPVSSFLARRALNTYMAETYADRDYEVERFGYSFKTGDYFANIQSPSSVDTNFYIYMDMLGHVRRDGFDDYVTSGHNTYTRIWQAYKELTETVLDSPDFPYFCDIAYGNLIFLSHPEQQVYEEYPYYAMMSDLELDKEYDVRQLGREVGELIVHVQVEEVSAQKAAEVALTVKRLFDEADIPFRWIDLTLQYPKNADGSTRQEGAFYGDIFYEQITEEGLTDRLEEAYARKKAWYEKQDAIKQMEIAAAES